MDRCNQNISANQHWNESIQCLCKTSGTETDELYKKIAELEGTILRLKIESDVALQNEKIKAANALKLQKIQVKETRAELSKKNSQIIKMSEVVEDLRNNKLISDENAKFLNVNSTSFQFFDLA